MTFYRAGKSTGLNPRASEKQFPDFAGIGFSNSVIIMSFINGVHKWLESKVFLGEVVKDYGIVSEHNTGGAFQKTSILLCRRRGKLQIVVRTAAFAYLAASVKYELIPATCASQLKEIMEDVERRNLES